MNTVETFQPLSDFVLLQEVPRGETAGGIALPETADMGPPQAKVVAVGPGRISEDGALIPMTVKPGDLVMVATSPHSFNARLDFDGKPYGLIRQRDVVGVFTGN